MATPPSSPSGLPLSESARSARLRSSPPCAAVARSRDRARDRSRAHAADKSFLASFAPT